MGFLNNAVLLGGVIAGTFAATDRIDEAYINDLIIQMKTQYNSNPYEEVIDLKDENDLPMLINGEIFRPIKMAEMHSWSAEDFLAKMLYTERVNPKDDAELRMIAATALNRALHNNESIKDVCTNKKQYSGVMRESVSNWKRQPARIHRQVARDMIREYAEGVSDEYRQFYFFCNMQIVKELNPRAYKWFSKLKKVADFEVPGRGMHSAFNSPSFDKFIKDNPGIRLTNKHLQ